MHLIIKNILLGAAAGSIIGFSILKITTELTPSQPDTPPARVQDLVKGVENTTLLVKKSIAEHQNDIKDVRDTVRTVSSDIKEIENDIDDTQKALVFKDIPVASLASFFLPNTRKNVCRVWYTRPEAGYWYVDAVSDCRAFCTTVRPCNCHKLITQKLPRFCKKTEMINK